MSFKVIEKRDNGTTIAILDNALEDLTESETEYFNELVNKPNQNPNVNQYSSKKSERRNLIVKPTQKDIKTNNSFENKPIKTNRSINLLQSDQQIRKSNTLPSIQTGKKQNISQISHCFSSKDPEQMTKRLNIPHTIKKFNTLPQIHKNLNENKIQIDLNKAETRQEAIKPTAPQQGKNSNQSPRKSIQLRNQTNLDKSDNEQILTRPKTPQIVKNSNSQQENQSPRKSISVKNQINLENDQVLNKENDRKKVEESSKITSNSNSANVDSPTSKSKRKTNHQYEKIFKKNDLLPPPLPSHENKITLVLDLDETLVHSVFSHLPKCDFQFKADELHFVSVRIRPGVKDFIVQMGNLYELVLFTVGNDAYATRIIDFIDPNHMIKYRLFRESCTLSRGFFVKDLSRLGRELNRIIILDDSPASYKFQPFNALPISSWIGDPKDDEIIQIQNFLTENHMANNVYSILYDYRSKYAASQNNVNKNTL